MALIRPIPSAGFTTTLVASAHAYTSEASGSVTASNIPAGTYLVTIMAGGNNPKLPTISITNGTATLLNSLTDSEGRLFFNTYLVTLTSSDNITANMTGGSDLTRATIAIEVYK